MRQSYTRFVVALMIIYIMPMWNNCLSNRLIDGRVGDRDTERMANNGERIKSSNNQLQLPNTKQKFALASSTSSTPSKKANNNLLDKRNFSICWLSAGIIVDEPWTLAVG